MNNGKFLAALIIAIITLTAAFGFGILTSQLLNLLPSPWGIVSNITLRVLGLTAIVYVWLGELEKKGGSHGEERL